MQAYGRKWRDTKPACVNGHVARFATPPFTRLDSTGEISSVHNYPRDANSYGVPSTLNNTTSNMKSCGTCKVGHWAGTRNLTNKTSGMDISANMFDNIIDKLSVNTAQSTKLIQPQCGIGGWNYNGAQLSASSALGCAIFPCHQFTNSFNSYHSGCPRIFGEYHSRDKKHCVGLGSPVIRMDNIYCQQQRPRYDAMYKNHRRSGHVKPKETSLLKPTEQSKPKCSQMKTEIPSRDARRLAEHCNASSIANPSGAILNYSQSKDTDPVAQRDIRFGGDLPSDRDININCVDNSDTSDKNRNSNSAKLANPCTDRVHHFTVNMKSEKGKSVESQHASVQVTGATEVTEPRGGPRLQPASAVEPADIKSDSNFHVLFIRKNLKKGRASASKQRRRKQQKAKSVASNSHNGPELAPPGEKMLVECNIDVGDLKEDTKCGQALSFYVGMSHSPPHTAPNGRSFTSNFVMSFSDDDDEDGDSVDGDWGDVEAELTQCNLFQFLPSNCSSQCAQAPMNFEVHISPVSGNEMSQKSLDDVNSMWNVQISLKDHRKQSSNGKKVHFPKDEDLAVVHPMVAWSFAYRSARRGQWEYFVRDRDRFQRRVQDLEDILGPIFNLGHRKLVFEQRFTSVTAE